jgi:ABC-2 type transport system permease protein
VSWALVAHKDFEDAIRSRKFWAIIGVSLLFLVIVAFGAGTGETDPQQELVYQLFNNIGSQLVVPVMGLIFGYLAVAGERESGSLRVLFGLTHGRRDVLLGKLLSRVGMMVVAMLVSSAVVAGLVLGLTDGFDVGIFLAFTGLTALLAVTFTGIAVGISAATGSRARAMGGAVGSYVAFLILWHPAVAIAHYLLEGELAGVAPPDWYLGALMLNPLTAYSEVLGAVLDRYLTGFIGWPFIVEDVPQEMLQDETALLLSNRAAGEAPFYVSEWFAVVVLLAWFVVPVALGYWRFARADLN